MKRYSKSGWHNESYRHYLASKGVSTSRYTAKKQYFADMMPLEQVSDPYAMRRPRQDAQLSDIQSLRAGRLTDAEILANAQQLMQQGLLTERGHQYLLDKQAKKVPWAARLQQFKQNAPSDETSLFSGNVALGGTLPTSTFAVEEQLGSIPEAPQQSFPPSGDVPEELLPSSEATKMEMEMNPQSTTELTEPAPLTEERAKQRAMAAMTPPIGAPENLLI